MRSECKKVEKNLIDLIESKLPEVLKVEIEDHLRSCLKCARLFRQFSLSWEAIAKKERKSPSASFWPALVERIQAAERPQLVRYRILAGVKNSLRPAIITLILLAGVFFGYYLGQVPQGVEEPAFGKEYFEEYFEAFEDFPPGSGGDFYLNIIREQEEMQ
jgi:predicted anti-sigma-YlaC factor YlaD